MEGQEIEEIGEDSQMTIEAKFRQTSPKQKLLSQIETCWQEHNKKRNRKGRRNLISTGEMPTKKHQLVKLPSSS